MSKQRAIARLKLNQRITVAMAESVHRHGVSLPPSVDVGGLRLGYTGDLGMEGAVRALQETFATIYPFSGEADGWPGSKFLCALWADNRPDARSTADRVVAAANMGDVSYMLGAGASNSAWFAKAPDEGDGCDCSAFVAWSLQRRKAGGPDWLNSKGQQNWLHTGSIVHDAQNEQQMFVEVEMQPWCIFSYADKGGKQGHTGWVVRTDPLEIIDCSSSQSRAYGDAIRLRPGDWLLNRDDVVYCVPRWWVHEGNAA